MSKKPLVVFIVVLLALGTLLFTGCSRSGDRYVGRWKAVQGGKSGEFVEITRDGSSYTLSIGNASGTSPAGALVEEGGKLVQKSPDGRTTTEISLDPSNGHLKWQMGGLMTMDMERQ